jgi:putative inorganic carbon (HCO3(-)) transporter
VLTLQGGVARIRAPGLAAVYFCLVFAVSYLLFGPRRYRILAVALALLSAAAVLASLNRNMIIGASLGVVVSAVFSRRRGRVAAVLVVAALVVWISLPYVSASPYMQRILSVGNYGLLKQSTLSDRYYENGYAWRAITHHPVFGIGFGTNYGAAFVEPNGLVVPRSFIHNQYLGLWLRTGLLGLVAYVLLLVRCWRCGIDKLRSGSSDAWVGGGLAASAIAFAASAAVGTYVFDAGSVPIVASLLALSTSLRLSSSAPLERVYMRGTPRARTGSMRTFEVE